MELIHEEVFLNDDWNERNPVKVYYKDGEFETVAQDKTVRRFELDKPISDLTKDEKYRILNYSLFEVKDEKVRPMDVFMQAEFITETTKLT